MSPELLRPELLRTLSGPDHKASLEPAELKQMVAAIRIVEQALGSGRKHPTSSELKNMSVARKSLVAARLISSGEPFTVENIVVKRPGNGLSPMEYWNSIGTTAQCDFEKDELITLQKAEAKQQATK